MIAKLLAHAGEDHSETVVESKGLLDVFTHQPAPAALAMVAFFFVALWVLLAYCKVNDVKRLLIMIPVSIGVAVVFMEYNPVVASIILSFGFIVTFLVALTMLAGGRN